MDVDGIMNSLRIINVSTKKKNKKNNKARGVMFPSKNGYGWSIFIDGNLYEVMKYSTRITDGLTFIEIEAVKIK